MIDDHGDGRRGRVRDIRELREPGVGWAQQSRFLGVIDSIGDENDRLVKVLRVLRMMVGLPGSPLDERAWEAVLMAAEATIEMETLPADFGASEPTS